MSAIRHLPSPDGRDPDLSPWWRLSSGERLYVLAGRIYSPRGEEDVDCAEQDALARLAAVRAVREAAA